MKNKETQKRFEERFYSVVWITPDDIWQFIESEINKAKIDENKKWAKATKLDSVNSFNFNNRISELRKNKGANY